jgi:prophage regulatory protein
MSQSEYSQKALALKKAAAPAARPAAANEAPQAASVAPTSPVPPAAPLDQRGPPGVRIILRMPQVEAATGLKQSHIYDLISRGLFPRGVKLSPQATGWFSDEIARWQEERPRAMGGWHPRRRADVE